LATQQLPQLQGMGSTRRAELKVRAGKVTTGQREGSSVPMSLENILGAPMLQMESPLAAESSWAAGRELLWERQACPGVTLAACPGAIPHRRNDPASFGVQESHPALTR